MIEIEKVSLAYPDVASITIDNDGILTAVNRNNEVIEIDQSLVNSFESIANNKLAFESLRSIRDKILSATDWWVLPDRTPTQAQIDYRQALRDLPQSADPQLDENGNLTNVTWPTYE
jgi:hypothetical protein